MKKQFAWVLAAVLGISCMTSAFADEAQPEQFPETEIIVFAAASMTETLTKIKETYEAAHPEVTITYNFDSSGTL